MSTADLVITNVRVVHHDHQDPQEWDVAVSDGVITGVGPGLAEQAMS